MTLKIAEGADIQYGDVDIVSPDDFKPENTRVRISIMVKGDVLAGIRERAATASMPYQTLINQVLADYATRGDQITEIKERVAALEAAVGERRTEMANEMFAIIRQMIKTETAANKLAAKLPPKPKPKIRAKLKQASR